MVTNPMPTAGVHRRHRQLLMLEAMMLLVPATALAGLGFLWSVRLLAGALRGDGNWHDPVTWMAVAIAAGLLGCLAGWWLLVRYLRAGSSALRRGADLAWLGAGIGFLAALAGAWLAWRGEGAIFAIGLAAVVPLAHLCWLKHSATD